MVNLSFSFCYALAVVFIASCVNGHSEPARPLKRLAQPSTVSLEILPRQRSTHSTLHRRTLPRSNALRHDDSFRLIISAFDDEFHLHLRPNDHLIHPAARINFHSEHGKTETVPLLRESVLAYWGEVIRADHSETRMLEDAASLYRSGRHPAELGWARIIVHEQEEGRPPVYEGAFSINGNIHHVMTKDNYLRNKHPMDPVIVDLDDEGLIIWRESDVMESTGRKGHTCGHDRLEYNTDPELNPILRQSPVVDNAWAWPFSSLSRRDDVVGSDMGTNFVETIGQTDGCPIDQRVLYMGVAADCKYVEFYGSKENATQQILNDWNSASSLYRNTFNVSLGIVEIEIQDRNCPSVSNDSAPWNTGCSDSITLNDRLSLFSDWRGDKGEDGIGLWHLMSGCPTGTEVGIAWLATLCQQEAGGSPGNIVSGTGVSTAGRTEWQVVAHEIGHNFGAIHDCTDGCTGESACCPLSSSTCNANSQFIMSPVSSSGETQFSQCSIGNICSVMVGVDGSRTDTSCLVDPEDNTRPLISLSMCGNGIVEDGEDCDPGLNSNSSCCDAATCRLREGAQCDPASSPCCTDQCSFAPSTQVCRASKDSRCDQEERCTGNSSSCPTDIVEPNGRSCGDGDLRCASGECTSVAQQCRTVGASMGLREACPNRGDNSCQISCQDPDRANQCVLLSAGLIDGSPCGYGGTCLGGECQSGSAIDTARAWYTQNLQIAIPVTIVAGLVALAILWCLIRSILNCCRSRNRGRPMSTPAPASTFSAMRHARLQSYDRNHAGGDVGPHTPFLGGPPPQHPSRGHRQSSSRANWIDDTAYNGPGYSNAGSRPPY